MTAPDKQQTTRAPDRWRSLWNALTAPDASLQDQDDRQQAQLLATLTLVLIALSTLVALVLPLITAPRKTLGTPDIWIAGVGIAILVLAYRLSRTRRYRLAARLAVQLTACESDIEAQVAEGERAGHLQLLGEATGQDGFAVGDEDLLLVATHRVTWQKGLDLFAHPEVADALLEEDPELRVIVAGVPNRPDDEHSRALAELARRRPERVLYVPWWRDELERLLLRYADVLLMPSRYEPCGLAQMKAMRYFCVPLAHATGGLADTIGDVRDWEAGLSPTDATGFLFGVEPGHDAPDFDDQARGALRERMSEMLACHQAFRDWGHPAWPALARNGYDRASREFSWEARAHEHLKQFERRR